MPDVATRKGPGRPAAATRDEAFDYALGLYLRGRRVDLRAISAELGVSRTTLHRWFGTRENLAADVLAKTAVELMLECRRRERRRGAQGLLRTFDAFNRALLEVPALRAFIDSDRDAMRVVLRSDRGPRPALVACITELIEDEREAGRYEPPVGADTLAFAIVHLAEAFLYASSETGMAGDLDRLRDIEAVLLGV